MEYTINPAPQDVWIVSDNMINSMGFSTDENLDAMFAGKTGIALINDAELSPEPFWAGCINKNRLMRLRKQYQLEDFSILESLMILSITFSLENISVDPSAEDCLLIISTTKGDIGFLKDHFPPEKECFLWHTAQKITGYFRMKNTPLIISSACISGVAAVETGARLLSKNHYRNAIVCGIDLVSAFTVAGFHSFRSLSHEPCKPYDAERSGLNLGEGVATLILTNNKEILPGQHEIKVLGGAYSNDANHISGPSRTGDGLFYAMDNALKYSGITSRDIDFINLHGTATIFNDDMESKAVQLSGLSDTPVNSLKGYWGHTLGASGIMEIIASIGSLKRNRLIATHGFSTPGTPVPLQVIKESTEKELHTFMKTASGFGGLNAAIIISDQQPAVVARKTDSLPPHQVSASCTIKNGQIIVNNRLVYENKEIISEEEWIKSAFKNLRLSYPKFYKMDNLAKLGFVTTQYLLKEQNLLEKYDKKKISLLFSNSVSSLDTDIKHQISINDPEKYYPSPAVFVYTLPNILLGEICIKEKIQGETLFFISEKNNRNFREMYLHILFETTDTEAVITGWVDCLGNEYNAEISFIEKE